jgi:hypothetical protein
MGNGEWGMGHWQNFRFEIEEVHLESQSIRSLTALIPRPSLWVFELPPNPLKKIN